MSFVYFFLMLLCCCVVFSSIIMALDSYAYQSIFGFHFALMCFNIDNFWLNNADVVGLGHSLISFNLIPYNMLTHKSIYLFVLCISHSRSRSCIWAMGICPDCYAFQNTFFANRLTLVFKSA